MKSIKPEPEIQNAPETSFGPGARYFNSHVAEDDLAKLRGKDDAELKRLAEAYRQLRTGFTGFPLPLFPMEAAIYNEIHRRFGSAIAQPQPQAPPLLTELMVPIEPKVLTAVPGVPDLAREGDILIFRGVPVREMLAYPIQIAAVLLGISYWTLRRQVQLGWLRQSPRAMISRAELLRYLEAGLPAVDDTYAVRKLSGTRPAKMKN